MGKNEDGEQGDKEVMGSYLEIAIILFSGFIVGASLIIITEPSSNKARLLKWRIKEFVEKTKWEKEVKKDPVIKLLANPRHVWLKKRLGDISFSLHKCEIRGDANGIKRWQEELNWLLLTMTETKNKETKPKKKILPIKARLSELGVN